MALFFSCLVEGSRDFRRRNAIMEERTGEGGF
jgi:hypothetical protein